MIVSFPQYLHLYVFNAVVSIGCSKAVPLLQFFFVRESVVSYVALVLSFSSSFMSRGRHCFVIVSFPQYLHLYVFNAVVSVDCSKAVPLLQLIVRESVVSYVAFVLSFSSSFVPWKGLAS